MSSVMYTGGSGEGPICDFHIRSDQRKLGENKRGKGGRRHTRSRNFPSFLLFFWKIYISSTRPALTGENLASYLGSRGNSGAPWADILEASSGTASQVQEGSSEGDGERDKGECWCVPTWD